MNMFVHERVHFHSESFRHKWCTWKTWMVEASSIILSPTLILVNTVWPLVLCIEHELAATLRSAWCDPHHTAPWWTFRNGVFGVAPNKLGGDSCPTASEAVCVVAYCNVPNDLEKSALVNSDVAFGMILIKTYSRFGLPPQSPVTSGPCAQNPSTPPTNTPRVCISRPSTARCFSGRSVG